MVSTIRIKNLKGHKKFRGSFLSIFTITRLIEKNALEVTLPEEFSGKHPVFPVSSVHPYYHIGEFKFPSRNRTQKSSDMVEIEDSSGPVKIIIESENIRLNGK
ncbi:hypothetical protein O181_005517 [Austropuccinia psidii MF-1]|uniref:Uncharacterized protein n=1 Tax=Austropuccinia psidii MF-1 TaxID=1389203 RepID=A0A9Q3BI88_9BASI|nr:hypothetical protein [Austropuccinia psidii MF-1]